MKRPKRGKPCDPVTHRDIEKLMDDFPRISGCMGRRGSFTVDVEFTVTLRTRKDLALFRESLQQRKRGTL